MNRSFNIFVSIVLFGLFWHILFSVTIVFLLFQSNNSPTFSSSIFSSFFIPPSLFLPSTPPLLFSLHFLPSISSVFLFFLHFLFFILDHNPSNLIHVVLFLLTPSPVFPSISVFIADHHPQVVLSQILSSFHHNSSRHESTGLTVIFIVTFSSLVKTLLCH